MGWRDTVSNAVTLGGYQKLQDAKAQYEATHRRYQFSFENEKASRARVDELVEAIGSLTMQAFKALNRACKIAERTKSSVNPHSPFVHRSKLPDFERIEQLVVSYSETKSALGGAGVGSAALAGSWSVVSLVGAASTGTAISTLSGVAATNATLAWFGGGAIAAGGAGMAGGTAILGGIALLPVIGFMSWQSRAKAEKVILETNRLQFHLKELEQAIEHHSGRFLAANAAMSQLQEPAETLIVTTQEIRRALFPVPLLSFCIRKIRSWLGGDFYREGEAGFLAQLNAAIIGFEDIWHSETVISKPTGEAAIDITVR